MYPGCIDRYKYTGYLLFVFNWVLDSGILFLIPLNVFFWNWWLGKYFCPFKVCVLCFKIQDGLRFKMEVHRTWNKIPGISRNNSEIYRSYGSFQLLPPESWQIVMFIWWFPAIFFDFPFSKSKIYGKSNRTLLTAILHYPGMYEILKRRHICSINDYRL